MTAVSHDPVHRRFEAEVDGHRAELEYSIEGDAMTITHTRVPLPIGGRGVAAELTRAALAVARDANLKVVPRCSYAAAYLAKHPEEAGRLHEEALLDEALDESFPASDPPSVGHSS
jgi:predicted GNAT family acetyltransferase